MSAALKRRLSDLEKAAVVKKPVFGIICVPIKTPQEYHEPFAPGLYRDKYAVRRPGETVHYTDRALLDAWLAMPERSGRRSLVYTIVTPDQRDAIIAKIESEI